MRMPFTSSPDCRLRAFQVVVVLSCSILVAACVRQPHPNVLIITIDTLRADHCSVYGYDRPTTPTLEQVAREGALFENCYAPMATTAPAHTSLFTGLHPLAHGVAKNGLSLSDKATTLAELFLAEGYQNAAIVSSFVVNRKFGLGQGFEFFDDTFPTDRPDAKIPDWEGHEVRGAFDQDAAVTTEEAAQWLHGRSMSDQPFFMWVHYFDPHSPYAPAEAFKPSLPDELSTDELETTIANYDAEIRETDAAIADLLAQLEEQGLGQSTLLAIIGDHGEGLMQHGHMEHGLQLYEEAVRVPLLIRWPGTIPAQTHVQETVQMVDLMPTILDLAGIRINELRHHGSSLAGALLGSEELDPDRAAFCQRRFYEVDRVGSFDVKGEKFAVRKGRWKYILAPEEDGFELYDLNADPGETTNLQGLRPDVAHSLVAEITAWQERIEAGPTLPSGVVDGEDAASLKALGYVD